MAVCNYCDTMGNVLTSLLGRRVSDLIMTRVKAKIHGLSEAQRGNPSIGHTQSFAKVSEDDK